MRLPYLDRFTGLALALSVAGCMPEFFGGPDANSGDDTFDAGEHDCFDDQDCPGDQVCLQDTFNYCGDPPAPPACPAVFDQRELLSIEGVQALAAVELDGDARDELLIATSAVVRVHRFDGGEGTATAWGSERDIRALTVVRANGPDAPAWLAAADMAQGALWIGSRGPGDEFTLVEERTLPIAATRLAPADLDEDGVEELLVSSASEGRVLGLDGPMLAGELTFDGPLTALELGGGPGLAVNAGGSCLGQIFEFVGAMPAPVLDFDLEADADCQLRAAQVDAGLGEELFAFAGTKVLLASRVDDTLSSTWLDSLVEAPVDALTLDIPMSEQPAVVAIDDTTGSTALSLLWSYGAPYDCRGGQNVPGRALARGRFTADHEQIAVLTNFGTVAIYEVVEP